MPMAASHLFLQELGLQGEGTFDYHLVARLQAVQDLRATPYDLAGPHRHRHEATISIATEDDGVALQLHQGFGGNRQAGRGRTRVTRTCWRIEQDFGRRVDLAALFAAPTVHGLAALLGSQESRDFDFRQVVRLQPNGSRPPMIAINNTGVYYVLAAGSVRTSQ